MMKRSTARSVPASKHVQWKKPSYRSVAEGTSAAGKSDPHRRVRGVEVLAAGLAHRAAVERVGEVRPELFDVQQLCQVPHLLVGGEGHLDVAVLDLRVLHQVVQRSHHLGHAGLVVGTQQRGSVRHHKILPLAVHEEGKVPRGQHHALRRVQDDVAAVIILHDAGLDILAGQLGRRVQVRDEADSGHLLLRVAGQRRRNIGVLRHLYIPQSQRPQLLGHLLRQNELPRRAGHCGGILDGLRVVGYVLQKTFERRIH